jgi:hypothetical protein
VSLAPIPDWAVEAARRLAVLGFLDVNGADPEAPGGPRLLVALRSTPTLVHFDPESIGYWAFEAERGRPASFSREDDRPADLPVSWGRVHVIDRIPVANEFVTFGGRLRAVDVDADTTIVEIASPAPILRWSGHSQGVDSLTDEVGAFFGRLMIPIDFQKGAEARIGSAGPLALYAAMLVDYTARLGASRILRQESTELDTFLHRETARLNRDLPSALEDGRQLLADLGMIDVTGTWSGGRPA